MIRIQKLSNLFLKGLKTRGLIYLTLGNFISAVLGAIFWFILARILIVENYGYINYILSLAALGGAFTVLGLNITIMTYIPKEEDFTHEADLIVFMASLVICILFVFLRLFYVAVLVVVSPAFKMFLFETLGRKQYKRWMFLSIGYRSGQLLSSLVLYSFLGIAGILIGYILPPLILGVPFFLRVAALKLNFSALKSKLNFSLHAYGINIAMVLVAYFDKILIAWFYGLNILGLYQLGYQFFWVVGILPASLFRYLLPEKASGSSRREVKLVGIFASIFIALGAVIGSPYVILWFFPHFVESLLLTQVMCIAVIPATIVQIESADLFGEENSVIVFKSYILALIVEIASLLLLGKFFDVVGLAISIVLSQTVLAVCLRGFKRD